MRPVVALCLVAASAQAQVWVDDFEASTLNSDWSGSSIAGQTLALSSSSAHRGDAGLHMSDTETVLTNGFGTSIGRGFTVNGQVFSTRLWLRVTWTNEMGDVSFLSNVCPVGPMYFGCGGWSFLGNRMVMTTVQPSPMGQQRRLDFPVVLTDGGWHLIENLVQGVRTDAGSSTFFVDGTELITWDGFELPMDSQARIAIGEVYGFGPAMAEFDYDDVRVDVRSQASTFRVTGPVSAAAGTCVALDVGLVDSARRDAGAQPTLAPYDVDFTVSGVTAYSDGTCTTAVSARIASGTNSRAMWVRPVSAFDVDVTHVDFLPGHFHLEVTDGGADAGGVDGGTLDGGADAGAVDAGAATDAGHDAGGVDSGQADGGQGDGGDPSDGGNSVAPPPPSLYAWSCGVSDGRAVALLLTVLARARRRRT